MKNTTWVKIFIGFGVVTLVSGIYLIVQGDYISVISGSLVGILLLFQNKKRLKNNE